MLVRGIVGMIDFLSLRKQTSSMMTKNTRQHSVSFPAGISTRRWGDL